MSFPRCNSGGRRHSFTIRRDDGAADIVWTLPGQRPAAFPGSRVFGVAVRRQQARQSPTRKHVQAFYEAQLRDEFRDVHPICLWAHDHGVIQHAADRSSRSRGHSRRLKLRSPTRLAGEALKALGANGIQMPTTLVADALSQKAIDGCVAPWEVVPAIKVQEAVKFHADFAASPTFYTSTFILAMNGRRYDSQCPPI